MTDSIKIMIKKYIAFIFICFLFFIASYLTVYKLSFLPNGYDIVLQQQDIVSIKSFNLFGMEKNITKLSFNASNVWMIDELIHAVNRQKEFLWLLYFGVSISIFLIIYRVYKGKKLWKAILGSNIIFAVVIPWISISSAWTRIQLIITLGGLQK